MEIEIVFLSLIFENLEKKKKCDFGEWKVCLEWRRRRISSRLVAESIMISSM